MAGGDESRLQAVPHPPRIVAAIACHSTPNDPIEYSVLSGRCYEKLSDTLRANRQGPIRAQSSNVTCRNKHFGLEEKRRGIVECMNTMKWLVLADSSRIGPIIVLLTGG